MAFIYEQRCQPSHRRARLMQISLLRRNEEGGSETLESQICLQPLIKTAGRGEGRERDRTNLGLTHKCIMEPSYESSASINIPQTVRIPDNKKPSPSIFLQLGTLRAALRLLLHTTRREANFTPPRREPRQILHSSEDDFLQSVHAPLCVYVCV